MEIEIINQQDKREFSLEGQEILKKVAQQAERLLDIPANAELSVLLVDNQYIRELNQSYRNIDAATDVLSFAMSESGADEPELEFDEEVLLLGDIVISLEQAEKQSLEYEHSFNRELAFLFSHGLLHLLGYDHQNEEEEKLMRAMQEKILEAVNLTRQD